MKNRKKVYIVTFIKYIVVLLVFIIFKFNGWNEAKSKIDSVMSNRN